jgi:hypothetical protein
MGFIQGTTTLKNNCGAVVLFVYGGELVTVVHGPATRLVVSSNWPAFHVNIMIVCRPARIHQTPVIVRPQSPAALGWETGGTPLPDP